MKLGELEDARAIRGMHMWIKRHIHVGVAHTSPQSIGIVGGGRVDRWWRPSLLLVDRGVCVRALGMSNKGGEEGWTHGRIAIMVLERRGGGRGSAMFIKHKCMHVSLNA